MSVQIKQTNINALMFQFSSKWQWDEWHDAITSAGTLAGKKGEFDSTPLIFNLEDSSMIHSNFMSHAWEITGRLYPHDAPTVIVTRSRYLTVMFESLKQINSNRLYNLFIVTSLDEARELIQQAASV